MAAKITQRDIQDERTADAEICSHLIVARFTEEVPIAKRHTERWCWEYLNKCALKWEAKMIIAIRIFSEVPTGLSVCRDCLTFSLRFPSASNGAIDFAYFPEPGRTNEEEKYFHFTTSRNCLNFHFVCRAFLSAGIRKPFSAFRNVFGSLNSFALQSISRRKGSRVLFAFDSCLSYAHLFPPWQTIIFSRQLLTAASFKQQS